MLKIRSRNLYRRLNTFFNAFLNVFHKYFSVNYLKLFLICLITSGLVYNILKTLLSVENEKFKIRPKIYLWTNLTITPDSICRLPLDINPYDSTVKEYINNEEIRRIICAHENQTFDWTYVDSNGVLRMNSSLSKETSCEYQVYRRHKGNDNEIDYLQTAVIDRKGFSMVEINRNSVNHFVKTNCIDTKTGKKYQNTHYWFEPNPEKFKKRVGKEKPSVLIIVIESLSRINFLRHMNLTKKAFESLGNVFYLNGLTKMADNSHPNMIPFLTGYLEDHFGGPNSKGPYDDYPFIWKKYKKSGYVTAFMEDHYDITLFSEVDNGRKGFVREQPVDWYTLPFWRHLESTDEFIVSDFCYYDRKPRIDIFLTQLQHFVKQCHKKSLPYFVFNFYIQVTHNRFNYARKLDSHYMHLFNELKSLVENHFVILMGDHGSRYGGQFLKTTIGRIEERMPLFGIHIPNSILSSNPHLSQNLNSNRDKLTNWLDINLMLNDIVNNNYSSDNTIDLNTHSYSVWKQLIPKNRTCAQALIPQLYCVCDERKQIDARHKLSKSVSLLIVKHINNLLPQECHQLFLSDVIRAEEIVLHSSVTSEHIFNKSKLYEVTILLNPSQAIIRSQIEIFNDRTDKFNDDITRLNRYGNQSYCVSDSLLRKICFCKN